MKTEKKCFKCGDVKPLSAFYRHPKMADGHVNKCKDCNKADVRNNRKTKLEHYREYDRKRGNRQSYGYCREYRQRFPNKYNAHRLVRQAIKSGKLFPEQCCKCGSSCGTHAHHDDYAKPLNVRWMCPACHKQWHIANGEGLNP